MNQLQSSNFLLIGGHVALDFVNTEVIEAGARAERLHSDRDVLAWASAAGAFEVPPLALRQASCSSLDARVWPLRAALRELLETTVDGERPARKALRVLNESLALPVVAAPLLYRCDRFEVSASLDQVTAQRVLREVALATRCLLTGPEIDRVRRCADQRCILYFVDRSRGMPRRWCSMDLCGNRAKVAAHHRRSRWPMA